MEPADRPEPGDPAATGPENSAATGPEDPAAAVDRAFAAVPRAGFLPPRQRSRAAYDGPLDIGHGQTNSQPRTVHDMLRLLEVGPGARVLDVGSGSGWTTALLAHLTGPQGRVHGVEVIDDLVRQGSANLRRTEQPWADIRRAAPQVLGLPQEGPFDRILVSAEARVLPEQLVDQLAEAGRMVVPVRGTMLLVTRDRGQVQVSRHGSYRFVPLVGGHS